MKRALALAVVLGAIGGCSTMTPPRYAPSADSNQALRKYAGAKVQLTQLAAPPDYSPNCRFMGPIQAADGQSIPEFVRNSFNDEFKFAGIYAKDGVSLAGALNKIEFSSISGVTDGWWELGIALRSSNGKALFKLSRTEFKSGFDAVTACNQTAQALAGAVQDLIKATVTDPDFKALLEPSTPPAQPLAKQASAAPAADAALPPGMPHPGDRWKYRYVDGFNGQTREIFIHEVTAARAGEIDDRMYIDGGRIIGDERAFTPESMLALAQRRLRSVARLEFNPYLQAFTPNLSLGRFGPIRVAVQAGEPWEFTGRVIGKEAVSVPAGTFQTMRIELTGKRPDSGHPRLEPVQAQYVVWYAPEAKRYVKYEANAWNQYHQALAMDRFELVEFRLK